MAPYQCRPYTRPYLPISTKKYTCHRRRENVVHVANPNLERIKRTGLSMTQLGITLASQGRYRHQLKLPVYCIPRRALTQNLYPFWAFALSMRAVMHSQLSHIVAHAACTCNTWSVSDSPASLLPFDDDRKTDGGDIRRETLLPTTIGGVVKNLRRSAESVGNIAQLWKAIARDLVSLWLLDRRLWWPCGSLSAAAQLSSLDRSLTAGDFYATCIPYSTMSRARSLRQPPRPLPARTVLRSR